MTPLLIQYLQNRNYEQRLETIFEESEEELDFIVEGFQSELKRHSEEIQAEMERQEYLTLSHFFMNLAVTQRNSRNLIASFQGFLLAAIHYSYAESYVRENECIGFMEDHLPFIDESMWKQIEKDFIADRKNPPGYLIEQLLSSPSNVNKVDPRRYNRILEAMEKAGVK